MMIGSKCFLNAVLGHHDETDAVRETPFLVWASLFQFKGSLYQVRIDCDDGHERIFQKSRQERSYDEPASFSGEAVAKFCKDGCG